MMNTILKTDEVDGTIAKIGGSFYVRIDHEVVKVLYDDSMNHMRQNSPVLIRFREWLGKKVSVDDIVNWLNEDLWFRQQNTKQVYEVFDDGSFSIYVKPLKTWGRSQR